MPGGKHDLTRTFGVSGFIDFVDFVDFVDFTDCGGCRSGDGQGRASWMSRVSVVSLAAGDASSSFRWERLAAAEQAVLSDSLQTWACL